ncbi:TM0106 family RecB-like putative nuclease [Cryobacterium sp. SO2]|uniref:TM0106 family RecB-like putative nuclease n=1 Tax=Cryobacterium sp. SO2 TaxID=1897060 RepID=UPI00223D350B|nr:bifunctional RecB family nuclease/DEAD/DEAH box helicase [Cryobacterium sp. SO2]WEO76304.1 TM0106 family RecB-like putative nuclease [Cryobacterium sp. SO2]
MFLLDTTVIFSATDLGAAAGCEWALMRKLDGKLGRIETVPDDGDAMLRRAGALGDAHELRYLETLRRTREVVEFDRPSMRELPQAAAATADAFRAGADVLFQATFFDGRFVGFADFIMRTDDGAYEVYDTKLARSAKITALLQVAAYSDQLQRLGIRIGENVHLLLGDGRTSTHRLRDILPVYRKRRARLERLLDERLADPEPTPWGDPRYTACGHCAACAVEVEAHRDVLLVAGMRLTQRRHLLAAGLTTIEKLAASTGPVAGLVDTTVEALRAQARLQLQSRQLATGQPGHADAPAFEVYNPVALGALPAPDAGDIFFDFEGDPLYSETAAGTENPEWGLDYLFGLIETDGTFRPFWAHDYAEERQALIDFLGYVAERRARHPNLHIYHYAAYERTHLLSLAARHGVGEDAVDDLLRANVLVDLYPVVKKSLRVGSRSYSIKKLEPLYMGADHREGVDNAADSITEYADSRDLFRAGQTDAAQAKLDAIADYNEYDCLSTLRLRDWLLARADEAGVPRAAARDLELDIPVREPSPVYLALAAEVADAPPGDRTPDQTAIALASAAIDYHRREGKKFWQEHFDRLRNPADEWSATRDVLIVERATVERDWSLVGRDRNLSRVLRIEGEAAPGSSLKLGQRPFLLYDAPYPPLAPTGEPGSRVAHERTEITGLVDEATGEEVLYVTEKLGRGVDAYDQLPMALTPATPPPPGTQVPAIAEWGQRVLDALPAMLPDAALDILRRVPPRWVSTSSTSEASTSSTSGASTSSTSGGDVTRAIRDTLLGIDRSYLAVQGPPGTGKTYTGSRVIAELVRDHGWKVGVVAQSHATVENMLSAVLKAGLGSEHVGKKAKAGEENRETGWTALSPSRFAEFTGQAGGFVLGGTAWDFSNAARIEPGSLDLLVIDEAGQFSLASTIASAVSARRLLLLGDPQQLPQVSQGSHPEPVDVSALGWLTADHDVLPPEFGYFLAKSWRMHPAVCAPVSRLSYEGKLESRAADRHLDGIKPGLHPLPVPHSLNSTSSPEEAEAVAGLIGSLLGRAWTVNGASRPLGQGDLIVVAPYNAQVEVLRERLALAGWHDVSVGTVDKFQGREAAVAIVSLAASSAEEVPRGLEFLLLANRLNVAISRAQWAAYLVYSPALTDALPHNAGTLAQLSAFIELVEG